MTKRIPLEYPVTVDGVAYDAVVLHRARGKDMRVLARYMTTLDRIADKAKAEAEGKAPEVELGKEDIEATLALIASLTDLPEKVVDEFDMDDITAIAEAMTDFFPDASQRKTRTAGAA